MWWKTASAAAALAVCVAGSFPGSASADPSTPTPAPPAAPRTAIDVDGTYAVGTDIAPGVYSTAGPVGDGTCFWKRTGNPDGATVDNALTKKAQTVQIDPTDQAFKTRGCQPWQLTDGTAPPPPEMSPVIAGLQLQAYMAQLNARAAASGQDPSGPAPAPAGPAPAGQAPPP